MSGYRKVLVLGTAGGSGGSSGPSGVSDAINTWTELAAVITTTLSVGTIKIWFDTDDLVMRSTVLRTGTDATDTANGIQRPADYAGGTNEKVWYQY